MLSKKEIMHDYFALYNNAMQQRECEINQMEAYGPKYS